MTNDEFSKAALGIIIGAVAAVALTKAGLTPQSAILRWISYCVVAGIIINNQSGMRILNLLFASFLSAVGLIGTILWLIFLGRGALPSISGVPLDFASKPIFAGSLVGGLLFLSTIGVTVGALSRPTALDLLQKLSKVKLSKAKKIESMLKIIVSIGGIVALFIL